MTQKRESPYIQDGPPAVVLESGKESMPDMDITDWIIRAAIFGVLAAVVIGTFQNLYTAIKKRGGKGGS